MVSGTSQITGYSQSHIWRMEKVGTFPKRYKLGPNAVGHDAHEVYTWMRNRVRGNCCAVPGKRVEKNSSVDPVNPAALKLLGTERTVEIMEEGEDDDGGEDEGDDEEEDEEDVRSETKFNRGCYAPDFANRTWRKIYFHLPQRLQ